MFRLSAILILGPTGAGKTPLGELWERDGIAGRHCFHFDFGARLRAADFSEKSLEPGELDVVRRSLRTGALLEDAEFPIALKILAGFIRERRVGESDLLILNGLPRHVGQAGDMEGQAEVKALVRLQAEPAVILARIRADVGGDREGRTDDDPETVALRLRLFEARTRPLEDHYARRGVPVLTVDVGPATRAEEMSGRVRPRLTGLFAGRGGGPSSGALVDGGGGLADNH